MYLDIAQNGLKIGKKNSQKNIGSLQKAWFKPIHPEENLQFLSKIPKNKELFPPK